VRACLAATEFKRREHLLAAIAHLLGTPRPISEEDIARLYERYTCAYGQASTTR